MTDPIKVVFDLDSYWRRRGAALKHQVCASFRPPVRNYAAGQLPQLTSALTWQRRNSAGSCLERLPGAN